MRRLCGAALVASIALALACGGGSGSGDGQLAQIQTATAENIARSVMLAFNLTADLSTIGAEVAGGDAMSAASAAAADALRIAAIGVVPLAAGSPFGPITVNCEKDGSVTLTGTVSSPDTLTANDHFSAEFDQCKELNAGGVDVTFGGPLDFTVVTFSGDLADLFSLTLDLVFCDPDTSSACDRDFSVTGGGTTYTVVGRARTVVDSTAPPLLKSSATGSTLALAQGNNSVALRSFLTTPTQDGAKGTYELTGNGRLASTNFDGDPTTDDGEVRYEVTTTLEGNTGSPPDAGVVLVTGANSAMQIVPNPNGTDVALELDLDGNGTFDDDTVMTTWADLGL